MSEARAEAVAGFHPLDIDEPEGNLIAYAVGGKITTEQAQPLFDRIEKAAAEDRKLRLYYEMDGFPSSELGVFFEKMKHMRAIFKAFDRVAIVGDQGWLSVYTKIFDPITKMDIRNFKVEERDAARAWVRE